jgi:hypothetical protein
MPVPRLNPEGLTWKEWADAAGAHVPMWICLKNTLWRAWIAGVDPSEYRKPNASH